MLQEHAEAGARFEVTIDGDPLDAGNREQFAAELSERFGADVQPSDVVF